MYYANQGNDERFQFYRSRVETHAIQRGTAWQVEIWAPGALISVYIRNHDAMGMKHARDVLERLAQEIPSLALYAKRAKGAYWVMRGRFEDAMGVLEEVNQGDYKTVVGATRSAGVLARAYNSANQAARAKALCTDTLSVLDDEDLELVVMNEIVSTELAIAEAHLGNLDVAEQKLDALIEQHLPLEGPLTLGMLFEARAQVALIRGDKELAREFLERMNAWHKKTVLPSLAARSEMLSAALERRATSFAPLPDYDPHTEDTSDTVLLDDD
jgi:tetratricopeptide (TPR) repeat protein